MPVKIFFCYAREDEALLDKIKNHLSPLLREGLIEIWYDRKISAGAEWEREVESHLDDAQIILLLISPYFMASDYCCHKEMLRAMQRHESGEACVIPILLRPVQWKNAPFRKLHALPKDGKPVTSWQNEDEAFFNIADDIQQVIEKMSPRLYEQNLRNIVQNYQKALEDARRAGYDVCPECGNTDLLGEQQIDYAHDEIYDFIHCDECGWFEEGSLKNHPLYKNLPIPLGSQDVGIKHGSNVYKSIQEQAECDQVFQELTENQRKVLQAYAKGLNPIEVAVELSVTPATIHTHSMAIYGQCRSVWNIQENIGLNYHFVRGKFAHYFDEDQNV